MFVRDPGIVVADEAMESNPRYILPLHRNRPENGGHATPNNGFATALWHEGNHAAKAMAAYYAEKDEPLYLKGTLEGGNVVQDPSRKKIFVGINFADYLNHHAERPNEAERQRYQESFDLAVKGLQEMMERPEYTLPDGSHYEVIPLRMKDETAQQFYHLDGAFACLPSGQILWCRELFTNEAQLQVERQVGRDNLIQVSKEDAAKGALNFITVGKRIITPHVPEKLAETLEGIGYEVVTPKSSGLKEGQWMFQKMGAVRCATMKITPDFGYPHEKGIGQKHQRIAEMEGAGHLL